MIPSVLEELDLLCLVKEIPARTGNAWSAFLEPSGIVEAAGRLLQARYHLEDITGLDVREGYLAAYSFEHMEAPGRVVLRVLVGHEEREIPTISHIYQGADWHEREAADFYGFCFTDHPAPIRLLLPPDMNIFPLRKKPESRASLRVLLGAGGGEVVRKKPDFTLLAPETPAEEPAARPSGNGKKEVEAP